MGFRKDLISRRQQKKIRDAAAPDADFQVKIAAVLDIVLGLNKIKTLAQEQISQTFKACISELEKKRKTQWETELLAHFLHCYSRPQLRRLQNNISVLTDYYLCASDLPNPSADYLPDLHSGSSASESG